MFKDNYKKAMSFPLREGLIQDTARLLENPSPIRRQNRRIWVRNIALAAAACILITLGVRYYGVDGVNMFAGAGSAAPAGDSGAAEDAAPAEAAYQLTNEPAAAEDAPEEAPAGVLMERSMVQEEMPFCDNSDADGALLESETSLAFTISLEEVRQLSSLGEQLDWAELERVTGISSEGEVPVEDGMYFLRVDGADLKAPPECVLLYLPEMPEVSIDIRYESLDVFLAEHP